MSKKIYDALVVYKNSVRCIEDRVNKAKEVLNNVNRFVKCEKFPASKHILIYDTYELCKIEESIDTIIDSTKKLIASIEKRCKSLKNLKKMKKESK